MNFIAVGVKRKISLLVFTNIWHQLKEFRDKFETKSGINPVIRQRILLHYIAFGNVALDTLKKIN